MRTNLLVQEPWQTLTLALVAAWWASGAAFGQTLPSAAAGLIAGEVSPAGPQADFVVDPAGDDRNPGTEAQPMATLRRARDAVRKLRKVEPARDVLVLIRGGTYHVEEPLVFAPDDSGREGGSVTYAAWPGQRPVLSGGRRITGVQRDAQGMWTARIPEIQGRRWQFEQLYVNGRRAVRARTPNRFYFYMNAPRRRSIDPATGQPHKPDDLSFLANAEDIAPLLALPSERLRDVVVASYHSWHISRQYVASIQPDKNKNTVFLTGSCGVPFFTYTQNERYFVENYREALDAPGEWFLDRDGLLSYKPLPEDDLRTAEVVAPIADTLLQFSGVGEGRPVANITVRGLALAYGGYRLPPEGQSSPQAACKIPAVVMADYARGITLEDCTIQHTGTYGVWFRDGCRDCSIERCLLEDLGAGGLRVGQTGQDPKPAERTSHIRVDNNILRRAGHVWPDAVGVLIGHSGDNQVTHNDISGMAYTGISAGWRWGYGEVPSARNSIRFNHIHHLGWDVLADMGGIYTLGEAPGTVLGNNVIHDIDGDGDSGMHGLYNDNSTSHMLLENNLVYNVRDGGYQIGSGRGNTLRNNVFVARPQGGSRHGQLLFCMYYPVEQHLAATFERNIIYGSAGKLLSVPPTFGERLRFHHNLYWEPSGEPLDFVGQPFDAWQKSGRDAGSLIADPKFVDPARHDFRLQADSPAFALGFVPIDYTQAGIYGDPAWIRKAQEVQYPPCEFAPPRPPLSFFDDFEDTSVGESPGIAQVHAGEPAGSIAVTEELAAGGRRCLKITDAPNLKYAHDPHFYYAPRLNRGRATLAFDIRVELGSQVYCEWREYPGVPYFHTGPRITIRDGKLTVPGSEPLPVPIGQWFHVEMSAGQGDQADGTWQLTLGLPGHPPKQYDLKTASPPFRATTWLGFVSDGTQPAVYYLDNVHLSSDIGGGQPADARAKR
ncbi:MAG: right-handed parallel beta-helix repeat-containing protein [Rhodopirellula sp.]|nr:right-handed parallel beta-helix repeat-containing protein [Rhodopirellula sp.]